MELNVNWKHEAGSLAEALGVERGRVGEIMSDMMHILEVAHESGAPRSKTIESVCSLANNHGELIYLMGMLGTLTSIFSNPMLDRMRALGLMSALGGTDESN